MDSLSLFNFLEVSIGASIGAFVGAYAAFGLETWRQKRNEYRQQIAAVNKAVFLLNQMSEELENIKTQCIDQYGQGKFPYVTMPPSIDSHRAFSFEIDKLTFLLAKQPKLLQELLLQERRYAGFFDAWRYRSDLHVNKVQPKFDRAGVRKGEQYEKQDIESALGPVLTVTMKKLTDEVVEMNSKTIKSITEFSEKFTEEMKKLFPKGKFIRFGIRQKTE